jgi:hypothetical protein
VLKFGDGLGIIIGALVVINNDCRLGNYDGLEHSRLLHITNKLVHLSTVNFKESVCLRELILRLSAFSVELI